MHILRRFSGMHAANRESRLLFRVLGPGSNDSRSEREDALEERVTRGRNPKTVNEAEDLLKSDARRCVEQMGKTKVGWLTWINHFCSTEAAMKANIRERADQYSNRMLQESGLYVNAFAGNIFRRGKRALMLVRKAQLEKEFLDDMQKHYREQEEALREDASLYGRLEAAFRKQQVSINVGSSAQRQKILNAIGSLQAEVDAEVNKRESTNAKALEGFREQAQQEGHLKNVLLKFGVVESSTQLSELLERNARDGDKTLYNLVKNHSDLNGADNAELRTELLSTIDQLARRGSWHSLWMYKGNSGWYREFLEGKKQPVNVDEVFQRLQDEKFDRVVAITLPGKGVKRLEVEKKDDRRGLYYLFDPSTKTPMILSATDREITYTDGNNRVRHFSFRDNPDSITLLN
jgi:hypothetical protein